MTSNPIDSVAKTYSFKRFYPEEYFKRTGQEIKPLEQQHAKMAKTPAASKKMTTTNLDKLSKSTTTSMVRKYMQPAPEVERFNENFKQQLSEVSVPRNSVFKKTALKETALENFASSKSVGNRLLSSTGKTRTTILQSIKNAKYRSERMKLPDQSTVKT